MDAKTSEALEASIKHWEEKVAAQTPNDVSISGKDCALCGEFLENVNGHNCINCPVWVRTGKDWCSGTPYRFAQNALMEWGWKNTDENRDKWRAAARAELAFLQSLRDTIPTGPEKPEGR